MVTAFDAAGFKAVPFKTTNHNWFAVDARRSAPLDLRQQLGIPDFPSGDGWIPWYFQSGSETNLGSFSEPAVDAEIQRIARLPLEQQAAAWGALDKTIMTDYYPDIVTFYQGTALLHGSSIGGMNIDTLLAMPTLKDIYVTD
jgi:peptide/nickel transport system substrate-binding protein